MRDFDLVPNGPVCGDGIASYIARFFEQMTVKEFIQSVLTGKPDEWGYIGIYDIYHPTLIFGHPLCEYKWGKLISQLPEELMDKVILSAKASGGWSRMDYILKIE